MAEFDFISNQKVTGWLTSKFQVRAETKEQAIEIIKEKLKNGESIETDGDETLFVYDDNFSYEDYALVKIHENSGQPTILVSDGNDYPLFDNVDVPDETINPGNLDERINNLMNSNILYPAFLVAGFIMHCEMVKQMPDEDLVRYYGFLYSAGSIRKALADVHKILTQ